MVLLSMEARMNIKLITAATFSALVSLASVNAEETNVDHANGEKTKIISDRDGHRIIRETPRGDKTEGVIGEGHTHDEVVREVRERN